MKNRRGLVGACLLSFAMLTGACANVGDDATPQPSGFETDADVVVTKPELGSTNPLPNNVPLVADARIVSGPTTSKTSSTGSGWTAVAVTPIGSSATAVLSAYSSALTSAGWTLQPPTKRQQSTLTGQKPGSDPARPYSGEWIQVSVTEPIAGAGPAVTFRYSTVNAPIRATPTPTPTVAGRPQ